MILMSYQSKFKILSYASYKESYKKAVKDYMTKHKDDLGCCVSYAGDFIIAGLTETELNELYEMYRGYENG